jgi:O-succinylbenzoic acid--CoA ligase
MTDHFLRQQAELAPDATLLESREGRLTYAEVDRLVSERVKQLGDRAGEQVVVRPRIEVESVIEVLAVARSGATAVVVAPGLPAALAATLISSASEEDRPSQTILFTSGSVGTPKGVRVTASNWQAAAAGSMDRLGHGSGDRWLCPLPLHHVGGLSIIYRSLAAGGSVVLAPEAADVTAWIGRVQFASLVPTQLHRALAKRSDVFTNRPVVLVGGGPSEPALLDQADTAGMVVLPTYGMTETTSQAATAIPGDTERRLFPLQGVDLRVGSDDRIEVKGPTVSPGYVGQPERAVGDWLATADRGRIESDGSLVVHGRLDRLIISGGEKIDPALVEEAIESHPDVAEAAVVGVPDREWGQLVAAVYAGTASPEDVKTLVAEKLPAYAVPKRWLRMESLPRNDLGKIDAVALGAMFAS